MASSASGGTRSQDGNDIVKDNYIPIFSNRPADYREYRARIMLYKYKMKLQKKPKEAVVNLLTSLTGPAWKLVERDADKLIESETGFDDTIALLDRSFKYNDRVECPKAIDRFFYQLSRRPEQTLMNFVTEFRDARQEIEKHGIVLPEEIRAYTLLKRAGLSQEQKQMILTKIGDNRMTESAVEEALYYLLGQDYRGRTFHDRGKGKGRPQTWQRRQTAYTAEDDWEDAPSYDFAELYDDEDDMQYDEAYEEHEATEGDEFLEYEEAMTTQEDYYHELPDLPESYDPETEEVYATYLDARRRFAELKANRGFWPVVALSPDHASSSANQRPYSPQRPHAAAKGGKKGKGKTSKGKTFGKGSTPPQKGDAKSRGKAALGTDSGSIICLRCNQPGHYAVDCPQKATRQGNSGNNSPTKRTKTTAHAAYMTTDHYVDNNTTNQHYYATQDGGASSMVAGHGVVMGYIQHICSLGVPLDHFRFRPTDKTFHFGGDTEAHSSWSVHMPTYINGIPGRIQCFIVEGNTPMLLGRPILKALNIKVDYTTDTFSTDGITWQKIPLGSRQEHLLQLDDLQDTPPSNQDYHYDLVTTETYDVTTNNTTDDNTYNIHHYLNTTGLPPPDLDLDIVMTAEDNSINTTTTNHHSHNSTDNHHDTNDLLQDDTNVISRPLTTKMLDSIQCHITTTNNRRQSAVESILRAHDRKQLQFWEVYSGSGNLAKAMQKRGYHVQTFDLSNGWDFTQTQHRRQFMRLFYQVLPDYVWLAPPWTKWSPLQQLAANTAAQAEALQANRDYEEHTHLAFTSIVYNKQKQGKRHATIEQPQPSAAWATDTMQQTPGHDSLVHQCQYGATMPDNYGEHQFVKKATTLRVTDEHLAQAFQRICHDKHHHLLLEGSSPETAAAAAYAPQMCEQWAAIIDNFLHNYYLSTESAYQGNEDEEGDETEEQQPAQPQHPDSSPHQLSERQSESAQPPGKATNTGILTRLDETNKQAAERTVQRLHRNLGHPTNKELTRLLKSRNASNKLIEAAEHHHCDLCYLHKPPPQLSKSTLRHGTTFNDRILADTLWISTNPQGNPDAPQEKTIPVLAIIDSNTKLMAARVLDSEKTPDLIQAVERSWTKHFGPPTTLQVDDHRGWSSETLRNWASDHGIFLNINPGQAHARLGILERRHQVLRRAVELYIADTNSTINRDTVAQALTYVIPQINNTPNLQGFSATQWTFGYVPKLPGHLMDEDLTVAQLTPSEQMAHKLQLKQQAAAAVTKADIDARLRRALLRQHQAQQHTYHTGQEVYYWRDAPGGAGPKIRWKGPATIAMVEQGRAGPTTNTYWLVHGTVLIRASAEHLRPHLTQQPTTPEDSTTAIQRAKQALDNVRNRSTTLYYDLNKSNKRKRAEVTTEDEDEDEILDHQQPTQDRDGDANMEPNNLDDYWDISEDGITWTRVHNRPRRELFVPTEERDVPCLTFRDDRLTTLRRPPPHSSSRFVIQDDWTLENASRAMPYHWTGTTTFTVRSTAPTSNSTTTAHLATPTTATINAADGTPPDHEAELDIVDEILDEPMDNNTLPAIPPTPTNSTATTEPQLEPEPPTTTARESTTAATPTIPEHQQQLYRPPQQGETFEQMRARVDRQETLSIYQPHHGAITYGPNRETFAREDRPHNTVTPYHRATQPEEADVTEQTYHTYDNIDLMSDSTQSLPPGWYISSNGTIELGDTQDEWHIRKGWLVRRHYVARTDKYIPDQATCPLPLSYLGKDRVTKYPAYTCHDRWRSKADTEQQQPSVQPWTGTTSFKILQTHRREAEECFYTASNGHSSYVPPADSSTTSKPADSSTTSKQPKAKTKARKEQLSEKHMTLEDRLSFAEAKKAELASFFQNDVWEIDDQSNAPEQRILRAHFILKWGKHADGTPRAKARLITQGFRDPDALAGALTTESPTLSRLSRNYILAIACMNGWTTFSADISTAFLQGKEHAAERTLWIKLSHEANRMLGLPTDGSKLLRLKKPMYGLCDAPRAWFLEAKERLTSLGAQQHPLVMPAATSSTTTTHHTTTGLPRPTPTATDTSHRHYVPSLAYTSTTSSDAPTATTPLTSTSNNNYNKGSSSEPGRKEYPSSTVAHKSTKFHQHITPWNTQNTFQSKNQSASRSMTKSDLSLKKNAPASEQPSEHCSGPQASLLHIYKLWSHSWQVKSPQQPQQLWRKQTKYYALPNSTLTPAYNSNTLAKGKKSHSQHIVTQHLLADTTTPHKVGTSSWWPTRASKMEQQSLTALWTGEAGSFHV